MLKFEKSGETISSAYAKLICMLGKKAVFVLPKSKRGKPFLPDPILI